MTSFKFGRTHRRHEYVDFSNGCSIQQSSAVGYYPDALDKPGSSFLWLRGFEEMELHFCREDVEELLNGDDFHDSPFACAEAHLKEWLSSGSLQVS